jgi:alpha-galactosidase
MIRFIFTGFILFLTVLSEAVCVQAQTIQESKDSVVIGSSGVSFKADLRSGKVFYRCANGTMLQNTVASIEDIHLGRFTTADFKRHEYVIGQAKDSLGMGLRFTFRHFDDGHPLLLEQLITLYPLTGSITVLLRVIKKDGQPGLLESRHIAPISLLPLYHGSFHVIGNQPRILDVPFDNDDWVDQLEQSWPLQKVKYMTGISYEFAALYDYVHMSGLVIGSIRHDTWKTGIAYRMNESMGMGDSLVVYGGAATPDDPKLQRSHGGRDGTHDHALHGTVTGDIIESPLIFIGGSDDIRKDFKNYGVSNAAISGRLIWKGYAPVYWNSFGVEDVLGYRGIMMPPAVATTSDFIATLRNFNTYAKPVLSIDSYDQSIYTTELLASLSRYAGQKNQQMGFYFIPFAEWTWKKSINDELKGTHYLLKDVVLRDTAGNPISYKDGDFCAYAMDPTHPAVRQYVISQLVKAKAINARFLKIDFLTAGSLESTVRFDPKVRTGMQAYNYGMKMLKHLADSIMGPDVFITMAISPMFPSQYAHTRFISTDVYSHLRDDQQGFPHYGSTQASLATGSHLWWVQGTLWPYTNLDVSVMKNFQQHPDLSETEVKVRLFAMMSMGSILGDGSDFRSKIAAERARLFLDNKNISAFFSSPQAFTPLRFADGESMDQQLSFFLSGESTLLSIFNFDNKNIFSERFMLKDLGLPLQAYVIADFLTGAEIARVKAGEAGFELSVKTKDALMVRIVPANGKM